MIGLGVGIDYALFIVTRYRVGLRRGLDPHAATVEAMGTAGRAVVFAGGTVMISLLGLLLMRLSFLQGLALGTSTAVLVAVAAAVTLLPALLGLAGRRIDSLSGTAAAPGGPGRRRRTAGPVGSSAAPSSPPSPDRRAARPAAPFVSMRLALADAGNDPAVPRRARRTTAGRGLRPRRNGPLTLVLETPTARRRLRSPASSTRSPAPPVSPGHAGRPQPVGRIAVPRPSPPFAAVRATEDLVRTLRSTSYQPPRTARASCPTSGVRPHRASTSPRSCPNACPGSSAPSWCSASSCCWSCSGPSWSPSRLS